MKRLRVDETSKEGSGPPLSGSLYHRQTLSNSGGTAAYPNSGTVKVVSEGMQSGIYPPATPICYGVMPAAATPHAVKAQAVQSMSMSGHSQMRSKGASPPTAPPQQPAPQPQQQSPGGGGGTPFQRLKVEDALSYLDQVKYKFGSQPQVYNDFLDIMKEFKSQSIDTPGVIQRVSNLFRGFPDLIVGFNTFLPPGYKIEVQKNEQGYAFQVSVSMPSPTTGTMPPDPQQQKPAMIFSGSGTIIHSNMSAHSQPITVPPSQQPLSLSSHMPTVTGPQAAAAAPPVTSVLHHSSGYGSGGGPPGPGGGSVGGGATGGTLPVHNNSTHNAITLSAAQAAVNQALGHAEAPQNQPVEFNHAINYVNKIKNRFQGQPEKYKRFLEILHTYQKEQRTLKESSGGGGNPGKHLTEQEVYSQVAKLFENQSDLLAEFGQFLPDATSHASPPPLTADHIPNAAKKQPPKQIYRGGENMIEHRHHHGVSHKPGHVTGQVKRSSPYPNLTHHPHHQHHPQRDVPPQKKHKISSSSCRDVTIAEAAKYCTLNDYAFFDKVRKALRSQVVYDNFLRCLTLFNQEIVSKSELVQLVTPFLGKFPELLRWFREFLGQGEVENIPYNMVRTERPQGEHAVEIDLSTAKRLGASYCIVPPSQESMKCSGRTQLCKEVLNDQWVSFPTWSEDSTFVSSRKTQYEEYMYRCEDERFELDVVIETNASTIRVLEGVQKKLNRMSPDEVARYRLDECLGGSSPVLHQRALKRIYGDKAHDIIEGLTRNPAVAVPVVLRRLKAKEEEWREAQKGFNKIWREQNEKYYLKSLDHQGINFKQNDVKALRSKSLFNEIETLFDERHEQNEEGSSEQITGPHLIIPYRDKTILDDAANLLIHHVKRQTGIQKGEKRRIKHILRQFVPEMFFHPKQQLSDDEREDDDEKEETENENTTINSTEVRPKSESSTSPGKSPARVSDDDCKDKKIMDKVEVKEEDVKVPLHAQTSDPDEAYTMFMANSNWYIFLRLHAILCERLAKIYERAIVLAAEEEEECLNRKESTAVALRLKPKPQIEVEDYYPAFLDMVKNLLDGNMDSNAYEDTLREMFGIHAYTAFTLDKVVQYAVRQLQHCVTERTATACIDLYHREQKRGGTGGPCLTAHKRAHRELAYQRAAETAIQDENCFKIFIYKKDCKITIELLDTEPADDAKKKVDDAKKWNSYKERYVDVSDVKVPRSPVFLHRNMRIKEKKQRPEKLSGSSNNKSNSALPNNYKEEQKKRLATEEVGAESEDGMGGSSENNGSSGGGGDALLDDTSAMTINEDLDKKLKEKGAPERSVTHHPGYDVSDETECKLNASDSKIMFTVNKDSYLYKHSAFFRAKQSHPCVTKKRATKFKTWLKKWTSKNVSETQHKQCTDWLMGRGEGVVPNRTRVMTNNDLTQTPYVPYNRYRVERLPDDTT
ncbi:paired amphipathic helix protein Sin3b [Agrilus planipennis]|uniref:Paired amphipathic helix protein Sin3a n=1 Tax=Agrilus planipennis TaxID=224129 RepID=A0A1W4WW17_AGRPL|nr:paired amphipathic helix protein Sin3b [Agrilus planipennis]